jgi:hypothetical protein
MNITRFPKLTPTERACFEMSVFVLSGQRLNVGADGALTLPTGEPVDWKALEFQAANVSAKSSRTADQILALRMMNYIYCADRLHVSVAGASMSATMIAFDHLQELVGAEAVERFKKDLKRQFGFLSKKRLRVVTEARNRSYELGAKSSDHGLGLRDRLFGSPR